MSTTKTKLRSLELYLSTHPDNEVNSECADRLSDVEELINNESALIKRNEELEEYLKELKDRFEFYDDKTSMKEITELLNKKH